MKKMFLRLVLLCSCLWRLDEVFGSDPVHLVSVKKGDSVTLDSDLTEVKDYDLIQWMFGNTLIAEINKRADSFSVYDDVLDGRFRDRLKLDKQTGSLTITNTKTEHIGHYKVQMSGVRKRLKNLRLTVFVKISVNEGDSVTLDSDLTELKDDDLIQWRFKTLIAEINKRTDSFTVYDDDLDGRFRDRLKLDNQTGSLTITNITMKHAGDYDLKINGVWVEFYLTVIVSLMEGDSVTLDSELTQIENNVIQWRFGDHNTVIAQINYGTDRVSVYDNVLDGRFRDRLKLDNQTGSLTITNITTEHVGDYKLHINFWRRRSYFRFTVYAPLPVPVISSNSSN
ncbi:uncharacterized protein [Pseudorasbora parva]|uniref:uncharacterized protein isoform X3 n=1 Tax=Pseudorasbora parva TaxID=51549 RepID=UPI00351DF608